MISEIFVDEIDHAFVPRPVEGVTERSFGQETVLIDEETGAFHALNPVGSVVWECFDGTVDLGTLADELAEAFDAPPDIVLRDIVLLAQTLALEGLLAGVKRPGAGEATGLDVGTELPGFRLPDLDGKAVELAALRGRHVLLLNWSPQCSYCVGILPELAGWKADLEERGTDLVLLSFGTAAANAALLDEHGASFRTLLRPEGAEGFADPFPDMGTPVGYLVDADGRVAAPLANGAHEVPALARKLAGVPEPSPADAKYLPDAGGTCDPGAAGSRRPRIWLPTVAYRVGEFHVGVRTDTAAADDVVGRMLAAHRVGEDPHAPANYSVVLADTSAGAARDLNLLLAETTTVVRSRSPRRVLHALAAYLSAHVEHESDGLLSTTAVAAVSGETAVLLPPSTADVDQLQSRLARLGLALVDEPWTLVDPDLLELVVPEPRVTVDTGAVEDLIEPPPSKAELARVRPGRYRLRAWFVWSDPEAPAGPAERAAAILSAVAVSPSELSRTLDRLDGLLANLPIPGLSAEWLEQLAGELQRCP